MIETYYVHYDNYGHVDELVFLLIMYILPQYKRQPKRTIFMYNKAVK